MDVSRKLLLGMVAGIGVGWGLASIGRPRAAMPEASRPAGPSAEEARLALGRELFHREWTPGDTRARGGDGVGPVFNDTSCVACHNLGGSGGGGPANKNIDIVTSGPTLSVRGSVRTAADSALTRLGVASKAGSAVVHRFGTNPDYAPLRAALFSVGNPEGAGKPAGADLSELARAEAGLPRRSGPLTTIRGDVVRSQRNPTSLLGAGLIDAIPEEVIAAAADRRSREFPEVTGRAIPAGGKSVGRFGWKAQTAGLGEFVRGACSAELGLDVPGHAQSADPLDPDYRAPGHDLDDAECDALAAYVRGLPAPVEAPGDAAAIRAGREAFASVGCATCHMPDLGPARGIYSDLSLHDMGAELGDSGRSYGGRAEPSSDAKSGDPVATASEWKTPPLWGVRDSAPYLHDGRAETLDQAIAFHGGEAKAIADRYFGLPPGRRRQMLAFLNTLGTPAKD